MSRTATPAAPVVFEPEFVALLKDLFEHKIVFNRILGVQLVSVAPALVQARLDFKPELVGHYIHNRIHGGVVSAALDALGGLAALSSVAARHMDESPTQRLHRFAKLGTIDLRIDYLRPVVGETFQLRAEALRAGSRVASTRMEWLAADGKLLCTGAGAYIIS